uniref:RRM domain-containing protein n=1 Tax=Aegilops tauschii subsp. strangulata TaxID=200361 RepID=A0A453Q133_AEGTS
MAHSCLSAARTAAALRLPFQADHAASVFPRPARASSSRPHAHRLIAAAPAVPVPRRSRRALAVVAMASQEEATAVEEAQEEDVQETAGQLEEEEPAGDVEEQQPEEEEEQGAAEEASSDGGDGSTGTGSSATKLYFGNLPYNCDSALLAGIVQDHAVPEMVEVLYDRTTGRSRGFAFVTMSTLEECERVIKNLDGTVTVQRAHDEGEHGRQAEAEGAAVPGDGAQALRGQPVVDGHPGDAHRRVPALRQRGGRPGALRRRDRPVPRLRLRLLLHQGGDGPGHRDTQRNDH